MASPSDKGDAASRQSAGGAGGYCSGSATPCGAVYNSATCTDFTGSVQTCPTFLDTCRAFCEREGATDYNSPCRCRLAPAGCNPDGLWCDSRVTCEGFANCAALGNSLDCEMTRGCEWIRASDSGSGGTSPSSEEEEGEGEEEGGPTTRRPTRRPTRGPNTFDGQTSFLPTRRPTRRPSRAQASFLPTRRPTRQPSSGSTPWPTGNAFNAPSGGSTPWPTGNAFDASSGGSTPWPTGTTSPIEAPGGSTPWPTGMTSPIEAPVFYSPSPTWGAGLGPVGAPSAPVGTDAFCGSCVWSDPEVGDGEFPCDLTVAFVQEDADISEEEAMVGLMSLGHCIDPDFADGGAPVPGFCGSCVWSDPEVGDVDLPCDLTVTLVQEDADISKEEAMVGLMSLGHCIDPDFDDAPIPIPGSGNNDDAVPDVAVPGVAPVPDNDDAVAPGVAAFCGSCVWNNPELGPELGDVDLPCNLSVTALQQELNFSKEEAMMALMSEGYCIDPDFEDGGVPAPVPIPGSGNNDAVVPDVADPGVAPVPDNDDAAPGVAAFCGSCVWNNPELGDFDLRCDVSMTTLQQEYNLSEEEAMMALMSQGYCIDPDFEDSGAPVPVPGSGNNGDGAPGVDVPGVASVPNINDAPVPDVTVPGGVAVPNNNDAEVPVSGGSAPVPANNDATVPDVAVPGGATVPNNNDAGVPDVAIPGGPSIAASAEPDGVAVPEPASSEPGPNLGLIVGAAAGAAAAVVAVIGLVLFVRGRNNKKRAEASAGGEGPSSPKNKGGPVEGGDPKAAVKAAAAAQDIPAVIHTPVPAPVSAPVPAAQDVPVATPAPVPAPVPATEDVPAAIPAPDPAPVPAAQDVPAAIPAPIPAPTPVPAAAATGEPAPEPVVPVAVPAPVPSRAVESGGATDSNPVTSKTIKTTVGVDGSRTVVTTTEWADGTKRVETKIVATAGGG